MKNLLDKIYEQEKSYGGGSKASKLAKDWMDSEISFYRGKGYHLNNIRGPLQPGKIHIFKYDPKTKDKLAFYDKNPVVISLGSTKGLDGRLEIGINLNFIPPKQKYFLMDLIWKTYYSQIKKSMGKGNVMPIDQDFVYYDYKLLKKVLTKYGFGFAIRSYYPSLMSESYVGCFEYWPTFALLDIKDMEGIDEGKIIKLFQEYIKKQ
tara:strand:- start:83 stop:700 length:618 start_codon:yes stop_codon:yes gene_type:complete